MMVSNEKNLEPGQYSLFVLIDDGTWEQPTYRIKAPLSERDFCQYVEQDRGGFISFGVQASEDTVEEHVRVIAGGWTL